jgi:hypothetical protein
VTDYWLADSEARVLGPVSLAVVRDLALRGKIRDVRAVSRDGRTFVPLREVPELVEALSVPARQDEATRAQADATRQIRDWLTSIKDRPSHEVFRVPANASRDAWRAAFFALIHRYVPSRLPADATAELRLACEDAFLALSERMVAVERLFRPAGERAAPPPPPQAAPSALPPPVPAHVTWRGGMIHVRLHLGRGDARPFTQDPDATWKQDSLSVHSNEKVLVNTPAEVTLSFEGHVTQLHATGRVVGVKTTHPLGFSVRLLDLSEDQRAMIRAWVARAQP